MIRPALVFSTWLISASVSVTASADPFNASSCNAGDPLCAPLETFVGAPSPALPYASISRGTLRRHSVADGTLTEEDRASLRAIGAHALHAGIVSTRKIPVRDEWQLAELRRLSHAIDGFAPAGACDSISATGPSVGLCTGTTKGPLGKVRVRMPVSVALTEGASGALRIVITNPSAMEIKPLLSWSPVVDPEHAKLVIDFIPSESGWLMYTRISVDMKERVSSADTIAAALEKLDRWLAKHLGA